MTIVISTHALREEGDQSKRQGRPSFWYFYPRPPRGGRLTRRIEAQVRLQFLPTPSARRATANVP